MSATAKDFTLTKRGDIWYARFRLPDGSRSNYKSTGETAKSRAEKWARDYLKAGDVVENENIRLKSFAENFYDWDGVYIRKKRLDNKSISQKWTETKQRLTNKYIITYFKNTPLTSLNDNQVELFRQHLSYELKLAPQTVNHVLTCLSEILKQAKKLKYIQYVPEIIKVTLDDRRPGILTPDEVQQLFFYTEWKHRISYLINLTMCFTGMRAGEAQGIQLKNIHPGYIEIDKTWDTEKLELTKTTKNKKSRVIAIAPPLQILLQELYDSNPHKTPDAFLFYSDKTEGKPIDKKVILKYLYYALEEIGITPADRKRRRIVAHSHRHFWNTFLTNNGVNKFTVQYTLSHGGDEMTEHYFHSMLDDQKPILLLQEKFFNTGTK
jgi:integrase